MSFTWLAHHSMIINNVSDFTHAYLHRRYRPFWDAKPPGTSCGTTRCRSATAPSSAAGGSPACWWTASGATPSIDLKFQYPYQCSDTGGIIKHWCFTLPVDAATNRVFFVFYFTRSGPLLNVRMPRPMMKAAMRLGAALSVGHCCARTGWAVEVGAGRLRG